MKQPVAILISAICLAFFCASLLYAATVSDLLQAAAQKKAQVEEALAACGTYTATTELVCDNGEWSSIMLTARRENGVWIFSCFSTAEGAEWEGDGIPATNVYWYGQMPDLYN
jgi:hypothetical protein